MSVSPTRVHTGSCLRKGLCLLHLWIPPPYTKPGPKEIFCEKYDKQMSV